MIDDLRYGPALEAVKRYVELGGRLAWGDLTPELLSAVSLGIGSDDGNLMLIRPNGWKPPAAGARP